LCRQRADAGEAVIAGHALGGIGDARAAGQVGSALLCNGRAQCEEYKNGEKRYDFGDIAIILLSSCLKVKMMNVAEKPIARRTKARRPLRLAQIAVSKSSCAFSR
jgi:hypothetical protein